VRPKLFYQVFTMELRKLLSYRANFWIHAFFGYLIHIGVVYYVWRAAFTESGKQMIGEFTFAQMVTYYVLALLLGKMVRGSEFGAGGLSDEIYQGTLTRYIIYPVRYFFFKYAQHLGQIAPALFQLLIFGAISIYAFDLTQYVHVTPSTVVMCLLSVAAANLMHLLIYWSVETVAFWQDSAWSLVVMTRFSLALLGGLMLPLSLFPEPVQRVFSVLPFQYLFTFPVRVMMGRVSPMEWIVGFISCLLWSGVFGVVAAVVWRRGMRQYTGVGI
jgi:ABC-2 type transport system permease protein